ncbi:hypothetical protein FRB99_006656 [Tulasnella sp. 403]|nr:hypothetical protein FRB99_006656 [Tulasnella sp. 403]
MSMTSTEFLLFSLKIQKLTIYDVDLRKEFTDEFSAREVQDIKLLLQGRPLFPNLREVWCRRPFTGNTAAIVLGDCPRVEVFEAHFPDDATPPVQTWIEILHGTALLRSKLHTPLAFRPIDFTRFRHLQYVELRSEDAVFDYEWWLMLSRCQELRILTLEFKTMTYPSTRNPPALFPVLQSFVIRSIQSVALWLLGRSMMPLLSRLGVADLLDSQEFCDVMTHLKQHSPYLEVFHIFLRIDTAFLMGDMIPSSLANFKLKKLTLAGLVSTVAIPDDRATFVSKNWAPLLEGLNGFCLLLSFQQLATSSPIRIATEETLVAILKAAKELKSLYVAVDEFNTSRFLETLEREYGGIPTLRLDHFSVEAVNTSSDALVVKQELRSAFPDLRNIHVMSGSEGSDQSELGTCPMSYIDT